MDLLLKSNQRNDGPFLVDKIEEEDFIYLRGKSSDEESIGPARMIVVVHGGRRVESHQFQGGEIGAHNSVRVFEIERGSLNQRWAWTS